MSTPINAVQGTNPHKGVKRGILGNPVGVPKQLPGFRGRAVEPGGPIKVPKIRNGNLNNSTSNVRIPYTRVCPLEFISSYQGRLGPGDVLFTDKYPPGFLSTNPLANNSTLGVNTTSRVLGIDGMNRLLMGSNPNGWRIGENVFVCNNDKNKTAQDVIGKDGTFKLKVLEDHRLDGVVISNDEPGAFMSSGSNDNAIFNIAIQGPVETNNGYLKYQAEEDQAGKEYNPLTGVVNSRTIETHARGSAESGAYLDGQCCVPGRVGSQYLKGKVDRVANICGTYSTYPAQMFDRNLDTLSTLYLGLRAIKLSPENMATITNSNGELASLYPKTDCYFFQYMPFSSRAAHVIHKVNTAFTEEANDGDDFKEWLKTKKVTNPKEFGSKQKFDEFMYDAIRSDDLKNMVGAYKVGRVMDTKAAVHDKYSGGPRDTSYSCIVDVGISWQSAIMMEAKPDGDTSHINKDKKATNYCLNNNAAPALKNVIGKTFGESARSEKEDIDTSAYLEKFNAALQVTEDARDKKYQELSESWLNTKNRHKAFDISKKDYNKKDLEDALESAQEASNRANAQKAAFEEANNLFMEKIDVAATEALDVKDINQAFYKKIMDKLVSSKALTKELGIEVDSKCSENVSEINAKISEINQLLAKKANPDVANTSAAFTNPNISNKRSKTPPRVKVPTSATGAGVPAPARAPARARARPRP